MARGEYNARGKWGRECRGQKEELDERCCASRAIADVLGRAGGERRGQAVHGIRGVSRGKQRLGPTSRLSDLAFAGVDAVLFLSATDPTID